MTRLNMHSILGGRAAHPASARPAHLPGCLKAVMVVHPRHAPEQCAHHDVFPRHAAPPVRLPGVMEWEEEGAEHGHRLLHAPKGGIMFMLLSGNSASGAAAPTIQDAMPQRSLVRHRCEQQSSVVDDLRQVARKHVSPSTAG